jgi:hypothetical protein
MRSLIQPETKLNFQTFLAAANNGDVSLVACTDAKGREFNVLSILTLLSPEYKEEGYMPFAILLGPSLYPLMNKIKPPDTLKGEWIWNED